LQCYVQKNRNAAQLANCILLHAYSRTAAVPGSYARYKQKLH